MQRYLLDLLENTASHAVRQHTLKDIPTVAGIKTAVKSERQRREIDIGRSIANYNNRQLDNSIHDLSAVIAKTDLKVARDFSSRAQIVKDSALSRGVPIDTVKQQLLEMGKNYNKSAMGKVTGLPTVSGRGDYKLKDYTRAAMRGVGSGLGGVGGAMLGGPLGGAVGSALGGTLGGDIARLVGLGDYSVGVNTIAKQGYKIAPGMPIPEFGGTGAKTRIRHREYVGDVLSRGNTDFNLTSYVVNPGNSTLFPWLSIIAQNYSQYEFKGLVAQFISTTSDITAGGGLGSVIMGTNYDVLQADYVNKQAMENAQFCVSARPSQSIIHTFECDPKLRPLQKLYIRDLSSSTSVSQDARFYDMGKFQVAVTGVPAVIPAGTQLGELWLSYDVEFDKADIADPFLLYMGRNDSFLFSAANRATMTDAQPFGTLDFPVTAGLLGGVVTASTYTFPPNTKGTQFYVHATWLGTPVAGASVINVAGVNVTITNRIGYPDIAGGPDASDRVGVTFRATVGSNLNASVSFVTTGLIIPNPVSQAIIYIFPVNPRLAWI